MPSLSSIPWFLSAALGLGIAALLLLHRVDASVIDAQRLQIESLSASIETQNTAVKKYQALAAAAQQRSQLATKAAQTRQAKDAATITSLLNRPLATSPEASCAAADAAILEFAQ